MSNDVKENKSFKNLLNVGMGIIILLKILEEVVP